VSTARFRDERVYLLKRSLLRVRSLNLVRPDRRLLCGRSRLSPAPPGCGIQCLSLVLSAFESRVDQLLTGSATLRSLNLVRPDRRLFCGRARSFPAPSCCPHHVQAVPVCFVRRALIRFDPLDVHSVKNPSASQVCHVVGVRAWSLQTILLLDESGTYEES